MQSDIKLDTLGYFCPMPIILTSKKIKELTLGQILEVLSDDEGIKQDMPAWCETTGHQKPGHFAHRSGQESQQNQPGRHRRQEPPTARDEAEQAPSTG
mgnify:CR=1 FL=1